MSLVVVLQWPALLVARWTLIDVETRAAMKEGITQLLFTRVAIAVEANVCDERVSIRHHPSVVVCVKALDGPAINSTLAERPLQITIAKGQLLCNSVVDRVHRSLIRSLTERHLCASRAQVQRLWNGKPTRLLQHRVNRVLGQTQHVDLVIVLLHAGHVWCSTPAERDGLLMLVVMTKRDKQGRVRLCQWMQVTERMISFVVAESSHYERPVVVVVIRLQDLVQLRIDNKLGRIDAEEVVDAGRFAHCVRTHTKGGQHLHRFLASEAEALCRCTIRAATQFAITSSFEFIEQLFHDGRHPVALCLTESDVVDPRWHGQDHRVDASIRASSVLDVVSVTSQLKHTTRVGFAHKR